MLGIRAAGCHVPLQNWSWGKPPTCQLCFPGLSKTDLKRYYSLSRDNLNSIDFLYELHFPFLQLCTSPQLKRCEFFIRGNSEEEKKIQICLEMSIT